MWSTIQRPLPPAAELGRNRLGAVAMVLVIVAVAAVVGAVVPSGVLVLVLVLAGVALCLGSPWHGTVLVVALTLLFPTPFSVHLAGVTLTIGRFFLYVLAVGWVIALRRPNAAIKLRRSALDVPILVFLGIMAASTIANVPSFSHHDIVGAFRRMLVFGVDYFVLFWIVTSILDSRERAEQLVRIIAGLVGFTAVLGVIEHFTRRNIFQELAPVLPARVNATIAAMAQASVLVRGEPRVISTFVQPLVFGSVLGMGLPLAIALALASSGRERSLWGALSVIDLLAMLFTFSRSVLVLAATTWITFIVLAPSRKMRLWLFGGLVAAGIVLLGTQPSVRHITFAMWQLRPGSQVSNTVNHRLQEIGPVLHVVAKRPLLGYGPRTFTSGELARHHLLPPPGHPILDNAYLGTLGSDGILGLGALGLVLVAAYATGWKALAATEDFRGRLIVIALIAVVQSWVLMAFVADVYSFDAPPELFFVLAGILVVFRRGWPEASRVEPRPGLFHGTRKVVGGQGFSSWEA